MNNARTTIVNLVVRGDSRNAWKLVLIEEGPWTGPVEDQLRRIQDRLYDCIEAALGGRVAEHFPESMGARFVLQLNCHDTAHAEVKAFFTRFASGILELEAYRQALRESRFVEAIDFAISFERAP